MSQRWMAKFTTVLIYCSTAFLLAQTALASPRAARKFGPTFEAYQQSRGILQANYHVVDTIRVHTGYGMSTDSKFNAFKMGFKFIPMQHNISPFLGFEFWRMRAPNKSGSLVYSSDPVLSTGLDLVSNEGITAGGGAIYGLNSRSVLGMVYVGYFFQ